MRSFIALSSGLSFSVNSMSAMMTCRHNANVRRVPLHQKSSLQSFYMCLPLPAGWTDLKDLTLLTHLCLMVVLGLKLIALGVETSRVTNHRLRRVGMVHEQGVCTADPVFSSMATARWEDALSKPYFKQHVFLNTCPALVPGQCHALGWLTGPRLLP
jgi:hypothetical protein